MFPHTLHNIIMFLLSLLVRFFKIQVKKNYLAQSLFPPGRFQKETVTDFPLIQRQFLLSTWSLWTPNQYWPLGSPLWRLHSSQERKPCRAGLDSSTKEPSLSSQKSEKCQELKFCMKIFKNLLNTKTRLECWFKRFLICKINPTQIWYGKLNY